MIYLKVTVCIWSGHFGYWPRTIYKLPTPRAVQRRTSYVLVPLVAVCMTRALHSPVLVVACYFILGPFHGCLNRGSSLRVTAIGRLVFCTRICVRVGVSPEGMVSKTQTFEEEEEEEEEAEGNEEEKTSHPPLLLRCRHGFITN